MAKKPTQEALDQAFAMWQGGGSNGAIMEATGLNYSQMWLDRQDRTMDENGRIETHDKNGQALPDTVVAAAIARCRAADESWGLIAVRCRLPESRVRRIFASATGISSQGLRIGRGGRYVADDPRFYSGADRPKVGTELDPGRPVLEQVPTGDENPRRLPVVAEALVQGTTPPKPRRTRKATAKKA